MSLWRCVGAIWLSSPASFAKSESTRISFAMLPGRSMLAGQHPLYIPWENSRNGRTLFVIVLFVLALIRTCRARGPRALAVRAPDLLHTTVEPVKLTAATAAYCTWLTFRARTNRRM